MSSAQSNTYQHLPDVVLRVIGHVVGEQRKEWVKERERIETDARAIIANLEAKVARLEVANEMLLFEQQKRVDVEIERLREALALMKDGRDGVDGQPGPQGEPGEPGKSVSAEEVVPLVLAQLPPPEKGEKGETGQKGDDGRGIEGLSIDDATGDLWATYSGGIMEKIGPVRGLPGAKGDQGEKGEAGPPGSQGEKGDPGAEGKDADPEEIAEIVLKRLPPPERGEPGPQGERGEPGPEVDYDLILRMVDDTVKDLPKPKDGVGLAGAMIDRSGALLLTLTDGTVRDLGQIVGRDGEPGKDGRDGKDGLSFDAFELEPELDERTLRLKWIDAKGKQQSREWVLPVVLYRGVFREGENYAAGDSVTFGGHLWIAQTDTGEKPGNGCKDWRLSVRAGRDGRDGAPGARGEKGERGPAGPERLITGGGS